MYDSMQSAEASACYVAHLCYFDSLQLEFTVKTGGFLDECVKCVDQVLDFGNYIWFKEFLARKIRWIGDVHGQK